MYYVLFSIIVNVLVGRCKLVLNRRYKSTVKKVFFKQKTKKKSHLEFCAGDISLRSFTLVPDFHLPPKPPFS